MTTILARISSIPRQVRDGAVWLWSYATRHKRIASVCAVVILGLAYWGYAAWVEANTPAQYTLARVQTDTIQETVTGSGQIAASHTLTLSPESSGTITSVRVSPGQRVVAGTIVATIDATDAQKAVRDAKLSLESARLTYEKSTRATNPVITSFNTAASAITDMQEALDGMDDILMGQDFESYQLRKNIYVFGAVAKTPSADTLRDEFADAKSAYDAARAAYNSTSRTASAEELSTVIETMQTAARAMSQANKDILAAARITHEDMTQDGTAPAVLSTYITSLTTYGTTLNALTVDLADAQTDLADAPADSAADAITLERAQNAYQDALDELENYVVRAPFAGTIATVDVQKYDNAGNSTQVATLITDTSYAELSLSETDAAKVKVGQKAELTFDALEDLTMTGSVIQVDTVGTVSSGVVSYTVKIGLDAADERVRPGMTVNATIITQQKDNALVISSSAIKTQNGRSYVEVATGTSLPEATASSTPRAGMGTSTAARTGRTLTVSANEVTITRVFIETGIESDTMTEIASGLSAGAFIVTQTTNASGKTVQQSGSIFSLFGGNRNSSSATNGTRTTSGSTSTRTNASSGGPGAGGPPPGI